MSKKEKTFYVCQSCGSSFTKWLGKCSNCDEWDSLVEEVVKDPKNKTKKSLTNNIPLRLDEIKNEKYQRYKTFFNEFDNAIGGGIVPGSIVLVGGSPGIGKSTLLLQISQSLALSDISILYISAEESQSQIKLRSERLDITSSNILIYTENNLENVIGKINELKPGFIVIDSIQAVFSPDMNSTPGTVSQIRECAAMLMNIGKSLNIPIFIIGHVTKEGNIAGPKILEHIVDSVLYFEGDSHNYYRILRIIKNRFGPTNEIAVFEMKARGLCEIKNPSEIFISDRTSSHKGSVLSCTIEGTRPLLLEIQALTSRSYFGYPQRITSGFGQKRLSLICAVLEKICGYEVGSQDIFINITGGIKVEEPAIDLPAAAAIISSFLNKPISRDTCFIGEIGLNGEIRAVSFAEQRIKEIIKMGIKKIIIPSNTLTMSFDIKRYDIIGIKNIKEIENILF